MNYRPYFKPYFKLYIHYSIYLLASFCFAFFLDISMIDDGLRHIAFAFNEDIMRSWGDVFPHSLFTSYDPWFLWHKTLKFFSLFVSYEYVHILVNTISLFFLALALDIFVRKEISYDFSSILYILVFGIVYYTSYKYTVLRPDLLSGLFVMYALLLKNRFVVLFLLTLFYGPYYYLFFIYTGSIGLVLLVQKNYKSFFAVFLASSLVLIFHLLYDFRGYIDTVKNILLDQKLREGLEVSEGRAMFEVLSHINYFVLVAIFFILCSYLIYKKYTFFKNHSLALFLLITSVLWLNQARYFHLFYPMIVVYILALVINTNKKVLFKKLRYYKVISLRSVSFSKKAILFYIIALPYSIFMFSYAFSTKSLNEEVKEADFYKNELFDNKIVLLNNMNIDIYKGLYHNPSMKFVPSCSIGWFTNKDEKMKDIYIRMQKENGISEDELYLLIKYVNADFYIHYLRNKKQILDLNKLQNFGILPKMIFKNRIIFKIDKIDKIKKINKKNTKNTKKIRENI